MEFKLTLQSTSRYVDWRFQVNTKVSKQALLDIKPITVCLLWNS